MSLDLNKTARTAGMLYLIVVLTGIFSLGYVPSQTLVKGDAAATVSNIVLREGLFRLGIVSGVLCYTAFLLLPLVLYRLLKAIDKNLAVLMVAFAVVSVPISLLNLLHRFDVLSLLSGAPHLQVFTVDQLNSQVMQSLNSYGSGLLILKIFWGLWLLPFGMLVFRSGYLPKVLGVLLMLGCCSYLIDFFGRVLFAAYPQSVVPRFIMLPATGGEIGTCLWLLIMGAGKSSSAPRATSAIA